MNEVCMNILCTKLEEIRELSEQLNSQLLSDAIQKLEEAIKKLE